MMAKDFDTLAIELNASLQTVQDAQENGRNFEVVNVKMQATCQTVQDAQENGKDFNVLTVELKGSNLIEASAGTGKTYSIAILALRLIIEKEIPLEKILMVTFTKGAVAELESRIRKFVRLAYKYASGKAIDEPMIKEVVRESNEKKIILLRKAVQSLDSLSVMTIHSFCLQTIDEFTFETNQSFDYEMITDDSQLLNDASIRYYREVLNILDAENFMAMNKVLEFEKMRDLLRKHLRGMKFIDSSLDQTSTIADVKERITCKKDEFNTFIRFKFTQIITIPMRSNALLNEALAGNVDEFKRRFCDQIKKPAGYFVNYEFMKSDFQRIEGEVKNAENEFINYFYLDFFRRAVVEINKLKLDKGYISFDDLIKTIHRTLDSSAFKEKLAKKYEAVFIDEFQDTDKTQYEIFSDVFTENSIVFYIGDPKQSIYGWRNADLDTYKGAKLSVGESVFSMNKNYRSTERMIDALNGLLKPDDNYNVFIDDEIRYVNVGQGASGLGTMSDQGNEVKPITIWKLDENDSETNYGAIAQEIYRLLTDDVKINDRKITPKDIGILVRSKKEGEDIKEALAGLNIPSVKRDEAKVFNSDESVMIKYLLKAVISPNRGDINRALHSSYFGFTTEELKTIEDEKHIEIFIGLRKILTEEGIYNMISSFMNIYGVRAHCMKDVLGQRILTNISQIAEILHKIEKQSKYTPNELLLWMERSSDESNEEFEQRIESDDESVQISTIHKAKGLEYNIVFALGLSMIPKFKLQEKGCVNDFKKEGEYYFTCNFPGLCEEDKTNFNCQNEQENRRLVYVTLTRAVYKCYISLISRTYYKVPKPSSLSAITDHYMSNSEMIEIKDLPKDDFEIIKGHYEPPNGATVFSAKAIPEIEIINTFGIHSFSALSKAHHSFIFEKATLGEQNNYDQFIFQNLGRGANVGTTLHSIFEHLNFADPRTWDKALMDALKYYPTIIKEESLDLFKQLVTHVMNAELLCDEEKFTLHTLTNEQKLTEMEFCFSMDMVNKTTINELLGEEADLAGEADIEGLMMGFIDLVFMHNGKYYILDWKSNHLGNSTENYDRNGMDESMTANNYKLQYMIYTIAVTRWLETKIEHFDYDTQFGGIIYVFLRGVREGYETGIYTAKPSKEKIEGLEKLFISGN